MDTSEISNVTDLTRLLSDAEKLSMFREKVSRAFETCFKHANAEVHVLHHDFATIRKRIDNAKDDIHRVNFREVDVDRFQKYAERMKVYRSILELIDSLSMASANDVVGTGLELEDEN